MKTYRTIEEIDARREVLKVRVRNADSQRDALKLREACEEIVSLYWIEKNLRGLKEER